MLFLRSSGDMTPHVTTTEKDIMSRNLESCTAAVHENFHGDRIVDRQERRGIIPYSDMHYSRLEKLKLVPVRIRLGAGRVGWSYRELCEWVEKKKSERNS